MGKRNAVIALSQFVLLLFRLCFDWYGWYVGALLAHSFQKALHFEELFGLLGSQIVSFTPCIEAIELWRG